MNPAGAGNALPGSGAGPALAAHIQCVAARADRAAFAALFQHFAPRLKSYFMHLGMAGDAAEDLAQETMLIVWRKAASFDPAKAGAATWIFTIARNLRIDTLRRLRRRAETEPAPPDYDPPTPAVAEEAVLAMEQETRLASARATLPAEQAAVVRLSYLQNKPHHQIEKELGVPLGTVKSRLRLALVRLRGAMAEPT